MNKKKNEYKPPPYQEKKIETKPLKCVTETNKITVQDQPNFFTTDLTMHRAFDSTTNYEFWLQFTRYHFQ